MGGQMNAAQPSMFMNLVPILFLIAIFYFLLIRPQQKQMKERKKMLESLKTGDRILTTGGIIGTIVNIRAEEMEVKIAENVKVKMAKSAVTSLVDYQK
jgi:preprotein translocase subunit YajC